MKKDSIPANESGKKVDLAEEVEAGSTEEATRIYNQARNRLLHPSYWKSITGAVAAEFTPDTKHLSVGDYIQVDIPAPGLAAGDGHDWVQVESIEEGCDPAAEESIAFTVEVCANPEHPEKGVAHFFAKGATSTFIITRNKNIVKASYHGRNEKPNLENPGLADKIRNAVVALGAIAGVSELQWKAFLKGLLSASDK